jgi:hypothetical protein
MGRGGGGRGGGGGLAVKMSTKEYDGEKIEYEKVGCDGRLNV